MTTWEKKRILVIAKAVPVESKKYNDSVCTAGITDKGEFIRIYPIPFSIFCSEQKFRKYDWIEVECTKAKDDQRKESYKVRPETIKVVGHIETENNWKERNDIILPLRAVGIDELERKWDEDRTSLGIIRVGELIELYIDQNMKEEYRRTEEQKQMVFDVLHGGGIKLKKIPKIKNVPRKFRYKYKCESPTCNIIHDMLCEDWEIFEADRKWIKKYKDPETLWVNIKNRFEIEFRGKDLHFILGTHFRMGTWMIIGIYYPKKEAVEENRPKGETNLDDFL